MSSSILAKMAEHSNVEMRDNIYIESSHGTLPAYCKCSGFLDFKDKDTLKCRVCGQEIKI